MSSKDLWKQFDRIGLKKKTTNLPLDYTPDQINAQFRNNFSLNNMISSSSENENLSQSFEFNEIEEFEIINAIHDIKSNAVGLDNIPVKFIKLILPLLITPLKYIFNQIIKTSIYPEMWKISKIIPIEKNKRKNPSLENLRPISILSALSKLFERVVKKINK